MRRERERERALDEEYASLDVDHVACADADLASVTAHLDDALDVLQELAASGAQIRRHWPPAPEVGEIHVALEELHEAALVCRDRLGVVRGRIQRLRDADDHFHVVGDRVMRMSPVEAAPVGGLGVDEDIPF
jgi:hypothetical protein